MHSETYQIQDSVHSNSHMGYYVVDNRIKSLETQ